VIINYSTGVGVGNAQPIAACPDMAALNMGSMNYAIYSAKQGVLPRPRLRQPVRDIIYSREAMTDARHAAEMECFDPATSQQRAADRHGAAAALPVQPHHGRPAASRGTRHLCSRWTHPPGRTGR
jgi:hypothetical protein